MGVTGQHYTGMLISYKAPICLHELLPYRRKVISLENRY